jgi:hypothetical protein
MDRREFLKLSGTGVTGAILVGGTGTSILAGNGIGGEVLSGYKDPMLIHLFQRESGITVDPFELQRLGYNNIVRYGEDTRPSAFSTDEQIAQQVEDYEKWEKKNSAEELERKLRYDRWVAYCDERKGVDCPSFDQWYRAYKVDDSLRKGYYLLPFTEDPTVVVVTTDYKDRADSTGYAPRSEIGRGLEAELTGKVPKEVPVIAPFGSVDLPPAEEMSETIKLGAEEDLYEKVKEFVEKDKGTVV